MSLLEELHRTQKLRRAERDADPFRRRIEDIMGLHG